MELMPATRDEIAAWFDRGVAQGATHMIVVCDTFSYEDYPAFVMPDENVHDREKELAEGSMQKVMEVYDLRGDREAQLAEYRAFNY